MNRYRNPKLAAALLAVALMIMPACMIAAETSPQAPGSQAAQQTMERLRPFSRKNTYHGLTVSGARLRQARLGGWMLNLRLHTPMGDEILFREQLVAASTGKESICLNLLAYSESDVITLQVDQSALDTLVRLGITEVNVADEERYVRAHYRVDELQAVRDALGLGESELLCVSGEDAPVTVVSEDGVRRHVN